MSFKQLHSPSGRLSPVNQLFPVQSVAGRVLARLVGMPAVRLLRVGLLAVGLLSAGSLAAGLPAHAEVSRSEATPAEANPVESMKLAPLPLLHAVDSGVKARLQAVSAVSDEVVWASGLEGRWVRTQDGGNSWLGGVIDAELQIRDVDAFNAQKAWALASGPGALSRIYRTEDGGLSWTLQHQNTEEKGFYDCLAAWSDQVAFVYGDSVEGAVRVLRTEDAGATWTQLEEDSLPKALEGEGGFAASGRCAWAYGGGKGFIVTGASQKARLLASTDWGKTWTAHVTPAVAGEASGLTSLAVSGTTIFAAGGRIGENRPQEKRLVASIDDGASWSVLPEPVLDGPIYGLATWGTFLLAVGPGGVVQVHSETGQSSLLSDDPFWSVALHNGRAWLVGPDGAVRWMDLGLASMQWQLGGVPEKPSQSKEDSEPSPELR